MSNIHQNEGQLQDSTPHSMWESLFVDPFSFPMKWHRESITSPQILFTFTISPALNFSRISELLTTDPSVLLESTISTPIPIFPPVCCKKDASPIRPFPNLKFFPTLNPTTEGILSLIKIANDLPLPVQVHDQNFSNHMIHTIRVKHFRFLLGIHEQRRSIFRS